MPADRLVVTGAAGFIGSCLAQYLNKQSHELVLVDDFDRRDKAPNLQGLESAERVNRNDFTAWLSELKDEHLPSCVFHLGARTDTTETEIALFDRLNLDYSKSVWNICNDRRIRLIYASSAATYGDGSEGYSDRHDSIPALKPLNPYGQSKQDFDNWVIRQAHSPPQWAGFKFFNVYGPNENHKGRMASVVWHTFRQIRETGRMQLFQSHREGIANGEQSRDFVYVKDVIRVLYWMYENPMVSGIFNLGTGKAGSFNELASAVFRALELDADIRYIPTPADIRDSYQYFTEADMGKLRSCGYPYAFHSLESGVQDYVRTYLQRGVQFDGSL